MGDLDTVREGFRLTKTEGKEPNYFTLHCSCGDGFIWRTDDKSNPWIDWANRHDVKHGEGAEVRSKTDQ